MRDFRPDLRYTYVYLRPMAILQLIRLDVCIVDAEQLTKDK